MSRVFTQSDVLQAARLVSCPRISMTKLFIFNRHTGGGRYPDLFEVPVPGLQRLWKPAGADPEPNGQYDG